MSADTAKRVDLNGDVGEGMGQDPDLMPLLTSANIACGAHAGDASTMRDTILLARTHGVTVGAHPSYPDRAGFGRTPMPLAPAELEATVSAQIQLLAEVAARHGVRLRHVKPHGALYNVAARDRDVAEAIAAAVARYDPTLILVGLSRSELTQAGHRAGLQVAHEAFADRAYTPAGTLVARTMPGAIVHDFEIVAARAVRMVLDGGVEAIDGTRVPIEADTLCVHGDTPDAAALARRVREGLIAAGVIVAPLRRGTFRAQART